MNAETIAESKKEGVTITVLEAVRMLNISKKAARAKLYGLVSTGRAVQLNPNVGPTSPGVYRLNIPMKDLLNTASDCQLARNGRVNYKKFCADPFNLGRGAR